MIEHALVLLLAVTELLLLSALDGARDLNRLGISQTWLILTLYHGEVGFVADVLGVNGVEGGFGETQIVDGIQEVGFALTVLTDKTVEFVGKRKTRLVDVLEVDDM